MPFEFFRFILTPKKEKELRAGIGLQAYGQVTIDLSTARNAEEYKIKGDTVLVASENATSAVSIQLNTTENAPLDLRKHRAINSPFVRFFITNSAQANRSVLLTIGGDGAFEAKTLSGDIVEVSNALKGTLKEFTVVPLGTGLTNTGIQYGATVDTTTADTYVLVAQFTVFNNRLPEVAKSGDIVTVYFELCHAVRAVSTATADITWVWEVKDLLSDTWGTLHTEVTTSNPGTSEVETTMSGWVKYVSPWLTCLPFQVRLRIKCNELNEGRARIRFSATWVHPVYTELS